MTKKEVAHFAISGWLTIPLTYTLLPSSALSDSANEKMLSSRKRFGRCLSRIRADMGVRVSRRSCAIRGEVSPARRVARLMREADMSARRKRHRVLTTKSLFGNQIRSVTLLKADECAGQM